MKVNTKAIEARLEALEVEIDSLKPYAKAVADGSKSQQHIDRAREFCLAVQMRTTLENML